MDTLWPVLVPDPNDHSVEPRDFMWSDFDRFFTQNANGPFCIFADEIGKVRKKTTHTQGLVAKIEWKPVRDPDTGATRFSGIYNEGTETAILRLSESRNLHEKSKGLLPSIAIKFLTDYTHSENIFGMPNFTGIYTDEETGEEYSSWNFFEKTLKSRLDRLPDDGCHRESLEAKMLEANREPYATGVSAPAFWTTRSGVAPDGTTHEQMLVEETDKSLKNDRETYQFPFQLEYEGVQNFPDDREEEWYDRLRYHFNT